MAATYVVQAVPGPGAGSGDTKTSYRYQTSRSKQRGQAPISPEEQDGEQDKAPGNPAPRTPRLPHAGRRQGWTRNEPCRM
jgi:hypothetical protein